MPGNTPAPPLEAHETAPEAAQPSTQPGAKVRGRGPGKPFQKGHTVTRKGTKNKATTEAKDWALPLVPEVMRRRAKHRIACPAAKDCAMCRHYNDMVLHYAYGKPPQRHELVQATAKADTERLAKELGLTETETKAALAEVERSLAAARAAQSP